MLNRRILQAPVAMALVLALPVVSAAWEPLLRRGFFGVRVEAGTEPGLTVTRVIPGSTAEEIGLQPGDVILRVGDREVTTPREFVALVGEHKADDALRITFRRGEERIVKRAVLTEFPREELEHSAVIYDQVTTDRGYRLRTIVTRPHGGPPRAPAVLFIQGLGCSSIDRPFAADVFVRLVHETAGAGYVTMRVEKSGIGDSDEPRCSEIDFHTELAGYRAGLQRLKRYDFVDPGSVFVFGLSMGGVMAPLLAKDDPVLGVAVYGTIGRNFFEYLVENRRRQLPRDRLDPAESDEAVRGYQEFMARFLFDRLTPEQILTRYPHLEGAVENVDAFHFFGRHASFYQQLYRVNLPAAWSALEAYVLAMHGEFDWVSSRADHEQIAAIVNGRSPGRGRFAPLPGLDHGLTAHVTLQDSYDNYLKGETSSRALDTLLAWIGEMLGTGRPEEASARSVSE